MPRPESSPSRPTTPAASAPASTPPELRCSKPSTAIANTRAKLDGTGNDDIGVGTDANGAATIVNADSNAIAFSRTTTQVLSVVYGGGSAGGAFFPNGLNGTIK